MAPDRQKWAYVEADKPDPAADFRITHSPSDYAGFSGPNDLYNVVAPALQHIIMSQGHRDNFYLGFDGERYFVLHGRQGTGTDNAGRLISKICGYFSETGDYSDNFPIVGVEKGNHEFGHIVMARKKPGFDPAAYNEYDPDLGDFMRQMMKKHPEMKERLMEAGRTKTPVVYELRGGTKLKSMTDYLIKLPAELERKGCPRKAALRAVETNSVQEERPGFLDAILEPDSAHQTREELRQLLVDKLKPGVPIDDVISSIMRITGAAQSPQASQRKGS